MLQKVEYAPYFELSGLQLLDAAPEAIVVVDQSGGIVLINRQFESLFGYTREELLGQSLEVLMPERFRDGHLKHRKQFFYTPRLRPMGEGHGLYGQRKDGTEFPIEVCLSPLQTTQGAFVISAVRDATAHRDLEKRLMGILETSAHEIYIFDAQSLRFVEVNEGARKNLGRSRRELARLTPADIKPEHTAESFEEVLRPLKDRELESLKFETLHQRKDGTTYPVEVHLQLSEFDSKPMFTAIVLDTTERERQRLINEVRTRTLEKLARGAPLDEVLTTLVQTTELVEPNIRTSILLVDPDLPVLRCRASVGLPDYYLSAIDGLAIADNNGACGTAAFRGERVITEDIQTDPNWEAFRDVAERAELRACWSDPILSSTGKVLGTLTFYSAEPGPPGSELLSLSQTGAYLASVAIERAQTDSLLKAARKNLEQRVHFRTRALEESRKEAERAKKDAENANIGKSRFLAAAGHDLRQPLQSLGLYLSVLTRQLDAPHLLDIGKKMRNSLDTMSGLLDALLDISKLDGGSVKPEKRDFALQELFDRIVTDNIQQANNKGLQFECAETHCIVHSDPGLLERVLENIVTNAIRYTQEGRVILDCQCDQGVARISVEDTGIGIAPEDLHNIFEEYYQLDNEVRDRRKGLGLGLSIVKHIARLLEHPVGVTSIPGSGSTFYVDVPVGKPLQAVAVAPAEHSSLRYRAPVVLFVDDDPAIIDATTMLLESNGVEVHSALCGDDAMALLAAGVRPDMVVSDYRLPGYNGVEVARRVRHATVEDLPIVLMTGDTSGDEINSAALSNCTVLHKPVDTDQLIALIENIHIQPVDERISSALKE